jgi:hypothetical protein
MLICGGVVPVSSEKLASWRSQFAIQMSKSSSPADNVGSIRTHWLTFTGGSEFPVKLKSSEATIALPPACVTIPAGGTGSRRNRPSSPQINSLGMQ